MQRLTEMLKKRLEGCVRVAVLGIGSELHRDDAAGVLVVRELRTRIKAQPFGYLKVDCVVGATAPENTTGLIASFKPSHIILVDAADTGAGAGECLELAIGGVPESALLTHGIPLTIIAGYLEATTGAGISLIGIQPAELGFGTEPTAAVARGIRELTALLYEVLRECDRRGGNFAPEASSSGASCEAISPVSKVS